MLALSYPVTILKKGLTINSVLFNTRENKQGHLICLDAGKSNHSLCEYYLNVVGAG